MLTKWTGNYLGGANKALLAPTGAKLIPKAPQIIRSGKAFVAGNRILNFLVPKTIGAAKTFGTGSLAISQVAAESDTFFVSKFNYFIVIILI